MKILFALLFASLLSAQIPNYYSNIDFTTDAQTLKTQLQTLITNTHTSPVAYTSSMEVDVWDVLKISDLENPYSNNVLLLYGYNDTDSDVSSDRLRDKSLSCHSNSCTGLWNREHVYARSWAQSPMDTDIPGMATDIHNLRACDSSKNGSRSNRLFTYGTGNASHTENANEFYPGDEWKGDIARTIMYMYLRYGQETEANVAANSAHSYSADMPDIFLIWNVEDTVSDLEMARNNVIESYQGNRNPFIDNPFLATMIWGGPDANNTWNLSIEDVSVELAKIKIYPNPVHSVLKINSEIENAEIINSQGKVVLSSNSNEISVENLVNGLYFIVFTTDSGKIESHKFIKN